MKPFKFLQRFVLPGFVITIIYAFRFGAMVSPRAEVEMSRFLKLGKGARISSFVKIKASDGPMTIGARVAIGSGAFISSSTGGVVIGDDSMISPNVSIVGANYRYDQLDIPIHEQGETSKGIKIGRDVWIGVGCSVLDGAVIGDGVIVTPNSVVSRRIPENAIASGNPAKPIFTRR